MFPNPHDAFPLPQHPSLEQYKKRAKDLLNASQSPDPTAIRTWATNWINSLAPPSPTSPSHPNSLCGSSIGSISWSSSATPRTARSQVGRDAFVRPAEPSSAIRCRNPGRRPVHHRPCPRFRKLAQAGQASASCCPRQFSRQALRASRGCYRHRRPGGSEKNIAGASRSDRARSTRRHQATLSALHLGQRRRRLPPEDSPQRRPDRRDSSPRRR